MNKINLITILFFLILSCKHNEKKANEPRNSSTLQNNSFQTINLTDPSNLKIEDIIDSIHYIQLETNMECLISNIRKIEAFDNKFYILDDKGAGVYIFDNEGHFISKISNQGRGPKEYIKITDINFDRLNKKTNRFRQFF